MYTISIVVVQSEHSNRKKTEERLSIPVQNENNRAEMYQLKFEMDFEEMQRRFIC